VEWFFDFDFDVANFLKNLKKFILDCFAFVVEFEHFVWE
jgi:hypothetical protein